MSTFQAGDKVTYVGMVHSHFRDDGVVLYVADDGTVVVISDADGRLHEVRGHDLLPTDKVISTGVHILDLHGRLEASSTRNLIPGEQTQDDRAAAAMHEIPKSQPRHHRSRSPNQARGIER